IEVSVATITAWEIGKSRPRKANLAQIVTLRNMNQSQVDQALGRKAAPSAVKPKQLKRLRKRLALTQAELARRIGVSAAAITSWETGKMAPGRKSRQALADLMQTPREQVAEPPQKGKGVRPRATPRGGARLSPKNIKAIRKDAGLSQRQMAEKMGVSTNAVYNWEAGANVPRGANLEKLLKLRK
ncbi:unnamed protein product, partial [marine sediment metagenome]